LRAHHSFPWVQAIAVGNRRQSLNLILKYLQDGGPGRSRTADQQFRKLLLYPSELRGRYARNHAVQNLIIARGSRRSCPKPRSLGTPWFAGFPLRWDNRGMHKSGIHKSMTIAVNTFAAGTLLLGQALAQQTPAATTQTAPASQTAPSSGAPAKTPATKRSSTSAKSATALTLKTQKEKFSYSLGMKMGENLHKQSVPVDPAIMARGLRDALSGGKTLLTDDQAQAAIMEVQNDMRQKQQAKMQVEGAANKKEGEAFLAGNKGKESIVTLPSGLEYKILKQGTGPKPTANDTVVCNYKGTLINGTEFDSSYKRGQPATFPVSGVIKGWTEALQLMPVGSKWQLFIPSDLAYGDRGAGPDIGPDSTLIFEVELMSIEDKSKEKAPDKK
jgi:FKBP-type peptidyl-prolyl cis-trans isomerase FklB